MDLHNRKAPRTLKDVSDAVRTALNQGQTASLNLVEWLTIDPYILLQQVLQAEGREHYSPEIIQALDQLNKRTVNTINETIGRKLLEITQKEGDKDLHIHLSSHTADMVRCWAAYMTGLAMIPITEKINRIRPFAADTHFGVREIAWMAVRPSIAGALTESIDQLRHWTQDEDRNVRRFATEVIRPRGVWCAHIEALKQQPEQALPILEPLKADPEKYVQDSVGNWLNDASKTRPDFVEDICQRWEAESPVKPTHYIIKKALRTLRKA